VVARLFTSAYSRATTQAWVGLFATSPPYAPPTLSGLFAAIPHASQHVTCTRTIIESN